MQLQIDAAALADFLAAVLGENSEIAVHDLADVNASLQVIRNGQLSGRQQGAPATDLARQMVSEFSGQRGSHHRLNYRSKTSNGRLLRSSTLIMNDEQGRPLAMLCVNTDDSRLLDVMESVRRLLPPSVAGQHQESLSACVGEVGEDILGSVLAQAPVPPSRMSAEEKSRIVHELERRGLFSIRGFVGRAAKALDISEPTLYRYLKQAAV